MRQKAYGSLTAALRIDAWRISVVVPGNSRSARQWLLHSLSSRSPCTSGIGLPLHLLLSPGFT